MPEENEITHFATCNSVGLAEMGIKPNCLKRRMRRKPNTPSLLAVRPPPAIENFARNAECINEKRLTFWVDKARRAASEHAASNLTEENERTNNTESPS